MADVESARSSVYLNGEQAEKELKNLQKLADQYSKKLEHAQKTGLVDEKRKYEKELNKVQKDIKRVKKEAFSTQKVLENLDNTSMNDLMKAYRKLKKETAQLNRNTDEYKRKSAQLQKVNAEINKTKKSMYGASKASNSLKDSLKSMFPIVGIGAAIASAGRLVQIWARWQTQLEKTRHEIRQLTGATGDMLDTITAKATAISKTFDTDIKETTKSANALAKQMNISYSAALDNIEKGFVNGANASGEFLDMVKEYPPQLKQVGLSADQAINIITQQVKQGVFSDKGIDAIKEAGISIGEMTNRTREAINGLDMELNASEIQEQLVSGKMSIFDAIQMISERMSELPSQGKRARTAMADIFRGAGENVGMQYLTSLKDINLEMEDMTKKADEYTKAQQDLVDANERLSRVMQEVAGGGWWTKLKARFKNTAASLLEFVNGLTDLKKLDIGTYLKALAGPLNLIPGFKKVANATKEMAKSFADMTGITATANALTSMGKQLGIVSEETKKFNESLSETHKNFMDAHDSTKKFNESLSETHKNFMDALDSTKIEENNKETQKSYSELNKNLKRLHKERTLVFKQQLAQREITKEQYDNRMQQEELSFLQKRKELMQEHGKDTIEIERKIAEKRIKIMDEKQELRKEKLKEVQQFIEETEKELQKSGEKTLEKELQQIEEKYQHQIKMARDAKASQERIQELQDLKDKEKQQAETAYLERQEEKRLQIKRKYGIAEDQELKQQELEVLKEYYKKGLIEEKEFQKAKQKIQEKYEKEEDTEKDKESDRQTRGMTGGPETHSQYQERLAEIQNMLDQEVISVQEAEKRKARIRDQYQRDQLSDARQLTGTLAQFSQSLVDAELAALQTKREKGLVTEEKYEKEKKEIKKKYATIQMIADIAQIVTNTAQAIMKAYAQLGPIAGSVAAGMLTATGAAQVAVAKQQKEQVSQLASGKYDVIGQEDKREYNNVPYQETTKTGIPNNGKPTLINETGGELVVDADTTSNIKMNAPELIEEMKAYQVPQRASGNLNENTGGSDNTDLKESIDTVNRNQEMLAQTVNELNKQIKKGILAKVSAEQTSEELEKYNDFRNDVTY